MGLLTPYIKEDWKAPIKAYKFKGTDYSLWYNYVTSPLANKLITFVPAYIA
jgi:hypothetical protein